MKTCARKGCNVQFTGHIGGKKFCSTKCCNLVHKRTYHAHFPVSAKCAECGGDYQQRSTVHLLCSEKCRAIRRKRKVTTLTKKHYQKPVKVDNRNHITMWHIKHATESKLYNLLSGLVNGEIVYSQTLRSLR